MDAESKHCKINGKYGKKKWTPGNQNTYSNPQNLRAQSYKADKAFVDLRERERERVTECDPVCVSVYEVGVREKGKRVRVFLVI